MTMIDGLIQLLEEKHGKKLDLENEIYYLFLDGGLFTIYYDEDEKSMQACVEMLPNDKTFVYFSNTDINKLVWQ